MGGGCTTHVRDMVVLRTTQPFALARTTQPLHALLQPNLLHGIGQPNFLHTGTAITFTFTDSRIINQTFPPPLRELLLRLD